MPQQPVRELRLRQSEVSERRQLTARALHSLVRPGHPSTPGYNDPAYPFYGRKRRE